MVAILDAFDAKSSSIIVTNIKIGNIALQAGHRSRLRMVSNVNCVKEIRHDDLHVSVKNVHVTLECLDVSVKY